MADQTYEYREWRDEDGTLHSSMRPEVRRGWLRLGTEDLWFNHRNGEIHAGKEPPHDR